MNARLTLDGCRQAMKAVELIFERLPGKRQGEYLGELNEVMLFLEAVERELKVREKGGEYESEKK